MATAELAGLVENCISKHGVHLIDLVMKTDRRDRLVEIYIDSEQGITTETCSEVSREVDRLIASAGIVPDSYRLTVSSPGIARPLKYAWQYRKHIGRELALKVRSQQGVCDLTGKMESMD